MRDREEKDEECNPYDCEVFINVEHYSCDKQAQNCLGSLVVTKSISVISA